MHFLGLLQHILFIHNAYFAVQGPLATWSTQGMEKSHYQACTSFFRSTRHGGGQIRSNALKELFNQFYRRQLQRYLSRQHENGEPMDRECILEENIDTQLENECDIHQDYMDTEPINKDSGQIYTWKRDED